MSRNGFKMKFQNNLRIKTVIISMSFMFSMRILFIFELTNKFTLIAIFKCTLMLSKVFKYLNLKIA